MNIIQYGDLNKLHGSLEINDEKLKELILQYMYVQNNTKKSELIKNILNYICISRKENYEFSKQNIEIILEQMIKDGIIFLFEKTKELYFSIPLAFKLSDHCYDLQNIPNYIEQYQQSIPKALASVVILNPETIFKINYPDFEYLQKIINTAIPFDQNALLSHHFSSLLDESYECYHPEILDPSQKKRWIKHLHNEHFSNGILWRKYLPIKSTYQYYVTKGIHPAMSPFIEINKDIAIYLCFLLDHQSQNHISLEEKNDHEFLISAKLPNSIKKYLSLYFNFSYQVKDSITLFSPKEKLKDPKFNIDFSLVINNVKNCLKI